MKRALVLVAVLLSACSEKPKLADPQTNNTLATVVPPETTTTTASTLVPADSQTPAAGTCALTRDGYAVIELNPDIPSPRGTIVHTLDRLRFHNATPDVVTIDVGYSQHEVAPDELLTLGEQLGDVWAKGVHRIKTSLYAGSGPEIWLK